MLILSEPGKCFVDRPQCVRIYRFVVRWLPRMLFAVCCRWFGVYVNAKAGVHVTLCVFADGGAMCFL